MLKLLGTLLLTGGGLAMGLEAIRGLTRRLETLRAFSAALELLERELSLRAPDTPDLLSFLSRRAPAPAGTFFAACLDGLSRLEEVSFPEIWAYAFSLFPALEREDREPLLELGASLGRYDAGGQRRAAGTARKRLEELEKQVEERRRREGKCYAALGLCLGLFAAILLL